KARVTGAARREQHAFAVRRPADRHVRAGVIRQAPWLTASGRNDVHVEVAVVLAGESDLRAVGRKVGAELQAGATGEPAGRASLSAHNPQIAGVAEGNVGLAQRGLLKQERFLRLGPDKACHDEDQSGTEKNMSHSAISLRERMAINGTGMFTNSWNNAKQANDFPAPKVGGARRARKQWPTESGESVPYFVLQ